jgi:hypothetical protein
MGMQEQNMNLILLKTKSMIVISKSFMPGLSSDLTNTDIPPEIVFVFLFLGLLK